MVVTLAGPAIVPTARRETCSVEATDGSAILRLKRKVDPAGQRSAIRDPDFIGGKRPLGGAIFDGNAEHRQDRGIEPARSRKITHREMEVVEETSLAVLHDLVPTPRVSPSTHRKVRSCRRRFEHHRALPKRRAILRAIPRRRRLQASSTVGAIRFWQTAARRVWLLTHRVRLQTPPDRQ